jgi:ceramide glucosyltransferase
VIPILFYPFFLFVVCSILYHLAVALAALRFRAKGQSGSNFAPPVSVLKPLRGIEQNFHASLATFFRQDYPNFEIIFGLSDAADAARWTIAQLQRDFPGIPVKVVTVPESPGPNATNPKMSKLDRMLAAASHEVIVLSDADIRVEPNYLRRVVRPLADEGIGLVTCLYRGIPAKSFLSTLEALGMSGDFAGQVLLARMIQGIRFGLGATMATRKKQITEIGGIAKWSDYLADDYILGREIAAAGYGVHLSSAVVETVLPRRTVLQTFHQQLRWARTIRSCSPAGYPGLIFVFGVPLALLAFLLQPASDATLATLVAVLIARFLSAFAAGVLVCRDRVLARYFWLLPLRDLLALGIWMLSFFGREVVWRDARFRLLPGGKIRPV